MLFRSTAYGLAYATSRLALYVFYFLLLVEFYALMVEEYPAMRRLGRMLAVSAIAAVGLAGALLVALDHGAGQERYRLVYYLVLQDRSVFFSLSVATLLLLWFAVHFRLRIPRNVWLVFASWGAYFVLSALLLTLREHFGQPFATYRNVANAGFFFLTVLTALGFLSRQGETAARPLADLLGDRHRELEAALSLQLRGLNQVLVKVLQQ